MNLFSRIVITLVLAVLSSHYAMAYHNISPYAWCGGNPVKFVDTDGKELRIYYKHYGETKSFRFTGFHGQKSIKIPKNQFIKDIIAAYVYNTSNGGGEQMRKAVTNNKYEIVIYENVINNGGNKYKCINGVHTVFWMPRMGNKLSNGGRQSAATALEHEIDHAVDATDNPQAHESRKNNEDTQYGNKEEKRAIRGSESKTAKANGEDERYDHEGENYPTKSPTSTTPL